MNKRNGLYRQKNKDLTATGSQATESPYSIWVHNRREFSSFHQRKEDKRECSERTAFEEDVAGL